ncbi:hypothetical protein B0H14DRAFT_2556529 [Mycena olivaceomarginata]|nr:hypothetical protein B0H14DRAFT_2556529 [Mycena olivaceomarginata]
MIAIPWHHGESLNILNIYAYNKAEEREKMWKDLRKMWADDPDLPFPNIVLAFMKKTLWAKFKLDVVEWGKHCSRYITDDVTRQIRTWKAQLTLHLHDNEISEKGRSLVACMLEKKISDRLREVSDKKTALAEARYDIEGKTLRTKSWTKSAKGYQFKETIHEFKVEEHSSVLPHYESQPKRMAEMARNYHNSVQHKDLPDEYGRMMATEMTLEHCNVRLSKNEFEKIDKDIRTDDVGEALKLSNNGKAPGLDGIPYEFYKIRDISFEQAKKSKLC